MPKDAKTFVIGDIHGGYMALLQCLTRCKFAYKKDTLIVLGDIVDGWSQTPQCIEELKKIKNLILIWGNHDVWLDEWLNFGRRPTIWTEQGGKATIDAYSKEADETYDHPLMIKHRSFFRKALPYYIDDQDRCFVHGGIPVYRDSIEDATLEELTWDRNTADAVLADLDITEARHKEIFLGHTTTERISDKPIIKNNIILLDTGGGWGGKLTVMDVDTKEFWQSDKVSTLYPNMKGRG